MINLSTFSRKPTETNLDPLQQQLGRKPKEDGNLFPKIKTTPNPNVFLN